MHSFPRHYTAIYGVLKLIAWRNRPVKSIPRPLTLSLQSYVRPYAIKKMYLFLKELGSIDPSTWGLRCIHIPCRAVIELRLRYQCGWYIMEISSSMLKFVVPCRRFESAWVIVSNPKSCVYCSRISKGTRLVEICSWGLLLHVHSLVP